MSSSPPPSAHTAWIDFGDPLAPEAPRWRWRFGAPRRWWVAWRADEVPAVLDAVHAASCAGAWCVGWVAYEAAAAAGLPVSAPAAGQALAVWAAFDRAEPWPIEPTAADGPCPAWQVQGWTPAWDEAAIAQAVQQVRDRIECGEFYQVNLTQRVRAQWRPAGDTPVQAALLAWFERLLDAQPGGYALLLDARAAGVQPWAVASVSPELFVDWCGSTLTTRPMKGTAARVSDPEQDAARARTLQADPKERAENVMIVDLLRNDLGRVAQLGSVRVRDLWQVQALPTVWQMTSTVQAQARAGLRLSDLWRALFPCGSVTGAPKHQAMACIRALERDPRGVYCGAAGIVQPGGRVTLNVPIRTLVLTGEPQRSTVVVGVGSGVTWGSSAQGEAAEWRAKLAFVARADAPFALLESLRLERGRVARARSHWRRLHRAALHFGWWWAGAPQAVRRRWWDALRAAARAHPQGIWKLRVVVERSGQVQAQVTPVQPWTSPVSIALAHEPMVAVDDFVRHKTTRRDAYARFVAPPGCVDVLLYNAVGEITECTIGNIAACVDGQWVTPPLSCGLLPGVMRSHLLRQGVLREARLTLDDIPRVTRWALMNSVRGWVEARLVRPSG
ncbi:MAG: bifunctional anthranilate synthase component I family protein/class IV aminotransferase [Tepidimonas taiwanensis]|nr:bifunctional anthranilate synthase component I family protein/class IV aminotransferase [Tepidimonas taiwanensis]